ncbi:MAG: DUF1844 domain-containing protein [Vicinamibacteria bacterium]
MSQKGDEAEPKFKVTDKRLYGGKGVDEVLSESGKASSETASATEGSHAKNEAPPRSAPLKGDERSGTEKETPSVEINFTSFVLSLSSSALLHFGAIEDPFSKKIEKNLPLAKQTIDILGILQEKTKGNLSKEEEDLLENVLYSLRMKYMQEIKR